MLNQFPARSQDLNNCLKGLPRQKMRCDMRCQMDHEYPVGTTLILIRIQGPSLPRKWLARFQSVIFEEIKWQLKKKTRKGVHNPGLNHCLCWRRNLIAQGPFLPLIKIKAPEVRLIARRAAGLGNKFWEIRLLRRPFGYTRVFAWNQKHCWCTARPKIGHTYRWEVPNHSINLAKESWIIPPGISDRACSFCLISAGRKFVALWRIRMPNEGREFDLDRMEGISQANWNSHAIPRHWIDWEISKARCGIVDQDLSGRATKDLDTLLMGKLLKVWCQMSDVRCLQSVNRTRFT